VAEKQEGLLETTERLGNLGSWEWRLADDRLVWSDNLFRIFGLEPGERDPDFELFYEHLHPEDRDRVSAVLDQWREAPEAGETVDYRFIRPDGDVRHFRALTARIERAGQRLVVGLVADRTDRRRAEREIAAHIAVAEALGAWRTLADDAPRLLEGLARALEMQRGVLWLPEGDVLRAGAVWRSPADLGAEFEEEVRDLALPRGVGVAGKAWESKRPVAISNIVEQRTYAFHDKAERDHLRGAVAIPATRDGAVLAVVALAGQDQLELSDRLRDSLVGIGGEIGEFLSRHRGQLEASVLTPRETEILQLVSDGLSGPAIARALTIAPATVKTHLANIYEKLGADERANAVAEAMRRGLIH
jgi:PAS domain S-box-containing protein